ncbi:MAG: hypothetical protein JXQ27_04150 [Acidobacteria bacterium]|nr:hypothetical protein [Acidobacteriota bacterium]
MRYRLIGLILLLGSAFAVAQQSPDEYLGVTVGADRTLVAYPDIIRYFEHLATESPRVHLSAEGDSTLGNPLYVAFISSPENIVRLDRLTAINRRLANPDDLTAAEAARLITEGRVFVLITAAIHATEIASTQMGMLLAHRLATTTDPQWEKYLDEVVLLYMPSINPDGNIMVTDWYNRYLGTDYEGGRLPFLYHHYAGHDNNRDFYMLNLPESRIVNAVLHHRYFPQIFLDMHQMGSTGPRMFVPPFKDPLNQNLQPVLLKETDLIGTFMALKLQEQGKQGVASAYAFDAYWPGGSKNTAWFKNVVGVLTEMASAQIATPIDIESNELGVASKGLPEYKPQVNFPDPWPGGAWRLRDIIDYELIAVEALLEVAAQNRVAFLTNFYRLGAANIRRGEAEAPFAYLFPPEQWDRPALTSFLALLQEHGIRLFRLDQATTFDHRVYPAGTVVMPLAQPYRDFIQVMMETQHYPEIRYMPDGPILEPYDASGWTLPLQMGISFETASVPVADLALTPLPAVLQEMPPISGEGDHYRIPARCNGSVIVINRLLKDGVTVHRESGTGDFWVPVAGLDAENMQQILDGTGVAVERRTAPVPADLHLLRAPRIAIFQPYMASMDEGWTRLVLDQYEFPFTVLHHPDFSARDLAAEFDVILFADMSRDVIVEGQSGRSRGYSSAGLPPEYRGGIGADGLKKLKAFIQSGGSVILMDSAWELAAKDFELPIANALAGLGDDKFSCPGSILRLHVDTTDPLAWGLPAESIIYFGRSPAFTTRIPPTRNIVRDVVAGFGERGPHLLSGYLKGGERLDRKAMIVRFQWDKGHVVVLGGRVQHRAQTTATFKFLFNALYLAGLGPVMP